MLEFIPGGDLRRYMLDTSVEISDEVCIRDV